MEWKVVTLEDGEVWEEGDGRDGEGRKRRWEDCWYLWGSRNMYDARRRKCTKISKREGTMGEQSACGRA